MRGQAEASPDHTGAPSAAVTRCLLTLTPRLLHLNPTTLEFEYFSAAVPEFVLGTTRREGCEEVGVARRPWRQVPTPGIQDYAYYPEQEEDYDDTCDDEYTPG